MMRTGAAGYAVELTCEIVIPPQANGLYGRLTSKHVKGENRRSQIDREVQGGNLSSLIVSLSAGASAHSSPKRRFFRGRGPMLEFKVIETENARVCEGGPGLVSNGNTTLKG